MEVEIIWRRRSVSARILAWAWNGFWGGNSEESAIDMLWLVRGFWIFFCVAVAVGFGVLVGLV